MSWWNRVLSLLGQKEKTTASNEYQLSPEEQKILERMKQDIAARREAGPPVALGSRFFGAIGFPTKKDKET